MTFAAAEGGTAWWALIFVLLSIMWGIVLKAAIRRESIEMPWPNRDIPYGPGTWASVAWVGAMMLFALAVLTSTL